MMINSLLCRLLLISMYFFFHLNLSFIYDIRLNESTVAYIITLVLCYCLDTCTAVTLRHLPELELAHLPVISSSSECRYYNQRLKDKAAEQEVEEVAEQNIAVHVV